MFVHPQFDPIVFSVGPLSVHWYGLMYLVGFALFWFLGTYRAKKDAWRSMSAEKVEDLLFYGVLGVILGGRLGYCLFYQPDFYLAHPSHIIRIWDGGMSAHGGIIGVILAMFYFAKTRKMSFLSVADFVVPLVPLGLFFGRIGNFINGELWGRVCSSDFVFAMIFPQAADGLERFLLQQSVQPDRCPFVCAARERLRVWRAEVCWKRAELFERPNAAPHIVSVGLQR